MIVDLSYGGEARRKWPKLSWVRLARVADVCQSSVEKAGILGSIEITVSSEGGYPRHKKEVIVT